MAPSLRKAGGVRSLPAHGTGAHGIRGSTTGGAGGIRAARPAFNQGYMGLGLQQLCVQSWLPQPRLSRSRRCQGHLQG